MKIDKGQNDRFEERLLARLKDVVAERERVPIPENSTRRRSLRPGLVLVGAAVALGIAGAFVLPMALDGGEPAYAVTRQADGTIRVEIHEFEDPDGLQERLEKEGLSVRVDYVPVGMVCGREIVGGAVLHPDWLDVETDSGGTVVFFLDPADYQDRVLVIEAEQGGDPITFYAADRDVGECNPGPFEIKEGSDGAK
jgi:hypothetical protein